MDTILKQRDQPVQSTDLIFSHVTILYVCEIKKKQVFPRVKYNKKYILKRLLAIEELKLQIV